MKRVWFLVGLLGLALAHHGWSSYDTARAFSATGTITEVRFEFPHVTLWLEVPATPTTPKRRWYVVLAPPSRMEARGLPSGSLRVGAQVTVMGYPHRSEPEEMRAERIVVEGRTIELR
ncbi:hypothetical protein Mlute_00700 [Meiothermus luteus]|jgi:hypothetical protein|uniref:DUF5666 domain-containing protein n=1 Tax=Meiothermus luteus TaxID=2026184 RepID=A0A399EWV3_9DEIN|nr:DUF6152 family protein [Meiothermus luteus]RIH88130.1 hypothetical protein Mlute_00700 [Meiothermus luteus]RMH55025.1 MAG: hypothetical protein D6684_08490 [Deinococcota bacterium]